MTDATATIRRPEPGAAATSRRRRPLAAIDLLKAYAIFGVLWQHTVPRTVTEHAMGNLWIRPAVPIFFVLLGLNLAGSLSRQGPLDATGVKTYMLRRLDRLALPLLLVLAAAYVLAVARGRLHASAGLLLGGLPVNAPGNYFIPGLIGVILLMPIVVAAYRRWPVATLVGAIAINVGFEVAAAWSRDAGLGALGTGTLAYQGCPLRYLALVGFGVWLSTDQRLRARRNAPLLALAVLSAAFLVVEQLRPDLFPFLPPGFLGVTNYLAAPWAVLLVMLGLRFLPAGEPQSLPARSGVLIGRASFHIYLVQMLFIGLVFSIWGDRLRDPWTAVAVAPITMLVAVALGVLYFRLVPGDLGLERLGRGRRSRADTAALGVRTGPPT